MSRSARCVDRALHHAARTATLAWRALEAPYGCARRRVSAGRALLELNGGDAALAEFRGAREVFAALDADPALAELADVMGDRRAGVSRIARSRCSDWCRRGSRIVPIGARQSLSEKTVARHLSNIFGKLGLSTRAGATAYAYENGLV